ncbi:DNA polymerase IV [Nocardia sp. CDC159]|uniref:DNA polymerase IV n=1 Tax=Nocardia pulmonis TaxID=2951408 RepID=A0A9X2EAZ8_9NOCA|nr:MULTISPECIES: DNA polymerase IV [Nocardia]MCM6777034.1 DNA polymerase IV [Nocardia pulmonis]MCM6789458.1 DNA polymerase IV [Nocardia sp. CDC159]
MPRWLLHVDLDQFQAAVEFRRHPELRGRPVVVGGNGDPNEPRKVVTCASYPARGYGVRAGMPLRTAARKCPDAVFLPLDLATYEQASAEVMDLLRTFPVRVEVLGWDEAFLAADTDDPVALAREIRSAIEELELTCSIGIGDNKLRAKLATGFAKAVGKGADADPGPEHPDEPGIFRLTADNWTELMAHRPTSALWGIGPRIAKRLSELGIETVAQLAAADRAALAAEFGPNTGPYLWILGHGRADTDVVTEPRIPVGRGRSETFPHDLTDRAEITRQVARLAAEVAGEMLAAGRVTRRVGVTVRTKTFYTRTKQRKLAVPTTDVDEIVRTAVAILDRFELDRPVRLLGVRLELVPQ